MVKEILLFDFNNPFAFLLISERQKLCHFKIKFYTHFSSLLHDDALIRMCMCMRMRMRMRMRMSMRMLLYRA